MSDSELRALAQRLRVIGATAGILGIAATCVLGFL